MRFPRPGGRSTRLGRAREWAAVLLACVAPVGQAGETARAPDWPLIPVEVGSAWQLNLPDREPFGASGLLRLPNGDLLTVSDRGFELFRVAFLGTNTADLVMVTNCFTDAQLARIARERVGHYDCEGLGLDARGRIYMCEERNRWILRCAPGAARAERLEIDWTPVKKYFSRTDLNASFEGVAIGDGRLYVANERQRNRLIVVDLATLRVLDDFAVESRKGGLGTGNYSDLCWFEGRLYVLMRDAQSILEVDPASHRPIAEYDLTPVEKHPEFEYRRLYSFVGVMEGLAVDAEAFWLVTDNNDLGRVRYPRDRRPTLFRCARKPR